jgi:hypothetical protein
MANRIKVLSVICLFSAFIPASAARPPVQTPMGTAEILAKHLSSAGGEEKLAAVKNFSFRTGPLTYFLSPDGRMKITSGEDPVITEVTLVNKSEARRNRFNNITELAPLPKATQQALALLRSGMFTLKNFRDDLEYNGLKKLGISSYHMFTARMSRLNVHFYLDSDEFLLRRLVFRGFDPGQGTYEINHDYAAYQVFEGIQIPTTWFSSQVGTRGNQLTISRVMFNRTFAPDFFDSAELNIGGVKISAGTLEGNIINVTFRRNMLTIGTNWTAACVEEAGFITGDNLQLTIGDKTFQVDFYSEAAPRNAYQAGQRFLAPNRQDENFIILMLGPENSRLAEELEPLAPIRIQKQ